MNKLIKIISSILIILVFFHPIKVYANFFTDDDWDEYSIYYKEDKSTIEDTIDSDSGGIFEKIIAKTIRRSC